MIELAHNLGIAAALAVANVIAPKPYSLAWDYTPDPESEGRAVAFNIWESQDLLNWKLIGTTTNQQFGINPAPIDFYRVSDFFTP